MRQNESRGHFRQGILFVGLFLICAVLVKPLQDWFELRMGERGPEPDVLYFSSPSLVKRVALGFDSLIADFYWMRTIQYYGRREEADKRPIRFKNLYALLDITTTLDPNLMDAYHAGGTFIAEPEPVGAGQPQQALRLLEKGIRAHPQDWRLLYDKGFIYYLYLQHYEAAGKSWLAASKLPSAPYWMASLAAMSLSKGGSVELAIALWQQQYRETNRADVRKNAQDHLLSFQVARDLAVLESLLGRFRAKTGSFPQSLQELPLVQSRQYAAVDPLGTPYEYDPKTGIVGLSVDTKIHYIPVPQSYRDQLRITNDELRITN
jgi:tetratricopeptide (TPR) repeat protein